MTSSASAAGLDAIAAIRTRLHTEILTRGRIVQIGAGGIGHILAHHVVLFLASLRDDAFRILLCDGDAFALENTYRMDVPEFDNKAAAMAGILQERFGRPGLSIRWVSEYVTTANVEQVIQSGDCVLLCVDNHATRKLVSDRCIGMEDVVLISGGNDGVEAEKTGTYGNVQAHVRAGGHDLTAPLDRFHPEIAHPPDRNPADLDCIELAGAGAPQLHFANLAVASAMCNALLRLLMMPGEAMYDEVCLDILEGLSVPHRMSVPAIVTASSG
ncbi:MAG: ThiF family adenylyltransferase [Planctomycetes bacterium]|nr:ThiF family adenylyltransferase [Planctomycetota bacterium]